MLSKTKLPPVRIGIKPTRFLPGEVGLFALRPIKNDSIVVEASHFSDIRFITWKDFEASDSITKKKVRDYCPTTPEGFFAPPNLNYVSAGWQMNHSCKPNVGYNDKEDFVAMRNIRKGEELCWDYAFDESNSSFKMKCRCGELSCRKIITGNDWKFLMLDQDTYKYFSKRLKTIIRKQTQNT